MLDQYRAVLFSNVEGFNNQDREAVDFRDGARVRSDFNLAGPNESDVTLTRPRRRSIDSLLWPSSGEIRDLFELEHILPTG